MACPPHHITSLSLDSDGWIVAQNDATSGRQEDDSRSIEVIPSCKRLLKETKLDLSCDIFNGNNHSNSSVGTHNEAEKPLEDLPHLSNLPNVILKVIADVRRLGAPSDADLRRVEKKEGGQENRRKNRRGRNGKVAQLEEQRTLRKQQEQEKLEQTQQNQTVQDEKQTVANGEKDDEKEVAADEEGFVLSGGNKDPDPVEVLDIPGELRLAAVFNTLRILVTLIRPMLDHPQRKDLELKMKNGPSIKKEGKSRFYLISKHVYSCVSVGQWNEISREYNTKLLNEMQAGLSEAMSKLNSDGQYELNAKDWVASLFNHESYMNHELVAKRSMGLATNSEVASKLHDALMNRFEKDDDEKQSMLQGSIDRLQDKLTSTISRRFSGVRLTVYGSCLSGLALEGSHDVDVSIFIPELDRLKRNFDSAEIAAAEYEKKMRKIIFQVRDSLAYSRSFSDLFAVTRARVPVIKGKDTHAQNPYTRDGSLSFDICFLNDIAVVNSSLLREYSLFDSRVRILMLSVKSFAKNGSIASAADGTLSSYSWINMVVFYLQCIGLIPVLQCPKLMEEHDFKPDPTGNPWHNVIGLQTFYLTQDLVAKKKIWECSSQVNDTKMSVLLFGFFNFYANIFPQQTVAASIRFGNCTLQKTSFHQSSKLWRLCMEDPFETCNSHCPHDLGCHVKEDGQRRINEHLMRATKELAALMQQETVSDDTISAFLCRLIGPMPTSNNGKAERDSANAAQSRYRPQNAHHQDKARSDGARHDNRNAGAKGRHHNNNQNRRAPKEIKRGNEDVRKKGGDVSTYMSARSQMKDGSRGGGGKNDRPFHTKKNGQGDKSTKQDHTDANSTRPNKQMTQANNPAVDKKFLEKQQERLRKISEEKSRKVHSKQKKKHGNTGNDVVEEKLNKPLDAKRNQTGDRQNQKDKSNKSNDRKTEN